jgi:tetratricopeptide (TPR) repeat protein
VLRLLRQFRLTPLSAAGLSAAGVLTFIGLLLLAGTIDEYRAGRAFNRALDAYAEDNVERVHAYLDEAIAAKGSYAAPQEVKGKLFIDEGELNAERFEEAQELFRHLAEVQEERRRGSPTLAVLIGRAVAELEAARARGETPTPSDRAVAEARRRLERAAEEYPDSGDVYVNLAAVALMENDPARCRRHLERVEQVGHVSFDALPYLYNLHGLLQLRGGHLPRAVQEFEKVAEFRPDWSVPRLNLAAAYGQSLLRGDLDARTAHRYAELVRRVISELRRVQSPLVSPVCHSLAVHNIRIDQPDLALDYFERAAANQELHWHARLNRAIAYYLAGDERAGGSEAQAELFEKAQTELQKAIQSPLLTSRDKFAAYCILATIHARAGRHEDAIAHFHKAEALATQTDIEAIQEQLPRIQHNLAALYYIVENEPKALEYLEKSKDLPEARDEAEKLLRQLSTPPAIDRFKVSREPIYTEYDASVRALVASRSSSKPLDPETGIQVTLHNALNEASRPIPFTLEGTLLRAYAVNLPQGRFTVRIRVTDAVENTAEAEGEPFAIDREPPRLVERRPASGSRVEEVRTIEFNVVDAINKPDLATLTVMVRLPVGAQMAVVSRGRYRYPAPDGSTKAGDPVTARVRAPLQKPSQAPGTYTVITRVRDTLGKEAETVWSFTVPKSDPQP